RGGAVVGTTVEVGVVKNKLAPPFRCATLGMHFSEAQPRRPVALSA
ncbi:MAG: DNA recombination/repair protein RecA, partial [Sphingobacteriia bacterium]|nr:DNA recombination/repair protein RecA [Sphingobacteriia bacterium]